MPYIVCCGSNSTHNKKIIYDIGDYILNKSHRIFYRGNFHIVEPNVTHFVFEKELQELCKKGEDIFCFISKVNDEQIKIIKSETTWIFDWDNLP